MDETTSDPHPESTQSEESQKRLAEIEKAKGLLFDDGFVREMAEKWAKDAESDPNFRSVITGAIDGRTGLLTDGIRAYNAFGNLFSYLPGSLAYGSNPDGPIFVEAFEAAVNNTGLDMEQVKRLNPVTGNNDFTLEPGISHDEAWLNFYRYIYPAIEKLVAEQGWSITPSHIRRPS